MTKIATQDEEPMTQAAPDTYENTDSRLVKQALTAALASRAEVEGLDMPTLLGELAELQSMLQADGPLASAYELSLLRDMRDLVAERGHRSV